jgi:hypothetical protein
MLDALSVVAFPTGDSVQFGDQAFRINITTILRNLGPIVAAKTGWSQPTLPGASNARRGGRPEMTRLPYSGFYTIRGGAPGADATMMSLRCGPSYNAHSHKDTASFELMSRQRMLLSDSGCYTYTGIKETVPKDERRRYYQGTLSHNTLTLDRRDAHITSLKSGPYVTALSPRPSPPRCHPHRHSNCHMPHVSSQAPHHPPSMRARVGVVLDLHFRKMCCPYM